MPGAFLHSENETPRRAPFEGVGKIVRFNAPMYLASLGSLVAFGLLAGFLPAPFSLLCIAAAAAALYLTAASLLVSHWIYDRSSLHTLRWFDRLELRTPAPSVVLNVHSGFDETTPLLRARHPGAALRIFDFYDPARHTEPSIRRARSAYPPLLETEAVRIGAFPVVEPPADLIYGLLSLHEIRDHSERVACLRELGGRLAPDGSLIVVEHLRDLPNFLAFGPGFLHFHSRRAWLRAFEGAGLHLRRQFSLTPFLRVFQLYVPSSS